MMITLCGVFVNQIPQYLLHLLQPIKLTPVVFFTSQDHRPLFAYHVRALLPIRPVALSQLHTTCPERRAGPCPIPP